LPLSDLSNNYSGEEEALLRQIERKMSQFNPEDFGTKKDQELKQVLDEFYWQDLPATKLGLALGEVTVTTGARKAWAVERIVRELGAYIEQVAFVGDSITDAQAEKVVEAVRGLAVAFNGNSFIIP